MQNLAASGRPPRRIAGSLAIPAAILTCVSEAGPVRAAIPEPDLVWYGRITRITNDTEVRVTTGTLTWEIEPVAGAPRSLFRSSCMDHALRIRSQ